MPTGPADPAIFVVRPLPLGLLGGRAVDPDDFRNGLALTGQPLAQREASLARTAETSSAVTTYLETLSKPAGDVEPTTCSVVLFAEKGSRSWVYLDCVRDQIGFAGPATIDGPDISITDPHSP
ncbi:MAG: hypothetical protein WCF36_10285 [Candidatus Nanopelagicales bacterium]